jgi:hypothetical protein
MARQTMDAGLPAERRVWIRAIVYIAVPHFFLGFLALLFYVGSHAH